MLCPCQYKLTHRLYDKAHLQQQLISQVKEIKILQEKYKKTQIQKTNCGGHTLVDTIHAFILHWCNCLQK